MEVINFEGSHSKLDSFLNEVRAQKKQDPVLFMGKDEEGEFVLTVADGLTWRDVTYMMWCLEAHFKKDFEGPGQ